MREKFENIMLPRYTVFEEIINSVSHGIGAIVGVFICIAALTQLKTTSQTIGLLIYGISVIILYTCSATYHGLGRNLAKRVMRMVDHSMIFVLISGGVISMLVTFIYANNHALVYTLSAVCATAAIAGISMVFIDQARFEKILLVMYFAIGSVSIAMLVPVYFYCENALSIISFVVGGGVIYAIGFIFYIKGGKTDIKYLHGIFHFFVLAGTLVHLVPLYTTAIA